MFDVTSLKNAIDLTYIPKEEWKTKYIGKGYRNSCYVVNGKDGIAVLFGYDINGTPKTFYFNHKSKVKYRVKYDTPEKDIFGNFVETKTFNNVYDRKKWLDSAQGIFVVEALRPEQEILLELFHENILDNDFNIQSMRTFYLDIETEISARFENPKDARQRINMITVFDSETKKFITWSLQHADINFQEDPLNKMPKDMFEFREFRDNEYVMLEDFINWWADNYPDVVTAWNGKAYDYPYIVRRIENIFGEDAAKKLSPVGRYRIMEVNHDNKRAIVGADIEVEISGIFLADDLILYRNKFNVKPALDGGYSLDNVGEAEEQGHKIHYSGTLKDLYEKDYQKFYEYNVRDVDLLKKIEDNCKLIPLSRQIVSFGICNYDTIYGSISYLIGSLTAFSRLKMGGVIFQSYLNEKQEKQAYSGAYVFPPKIGRYNKGVAVVDVNSLYPSTIRAINISPETYVGKVLQKNSISYDEAIDLETTECEEFVLITPSGKSKSLTKAELVELCKTKCIFSKNNTLFLKHSVKQGIVSAWCDHFYAMRKATKKEMQHLEQMLYEKKIPAEKIRETEIKIENLNNKQMALKIMLNSIYGIMGTTFSPIGNVNLAQTITRNGIFCNISTGEYVTNFLLNKFDKNNLNQNNKENRDKTALILAGDTDSGHYTTKIYIKR